MTLTKTTCPYCGVGCGVLAGADGTIKGDPDHPANFGRLCSKGSALGETIDLEGRLLHSKIKGRDATWHEALDLVADKFSAVIAEHGPDSVAFYASGQLLTEDYYVANKLMKGFIGSANIDTNSRLCMASSVAGHKRAFGTDTVPGTYQDLEQADLIVLVGSNLAWCHPVLYQRIAAAKEARPDMRVVNIDPRRTATTDLADLHLQIAPDGDVALFNSLLAHIADAGGVDANYTGAHVNGVEAAIAKAREADPADTGLTAAELAEFLALWAQTEKVVTVYSQGVNQSSNGTDKVNAILNCHLATGRIGKPGMGPFSVTGQPNAMGGREVGGLANMLANHLELGNADHRDAVQDFWESPAICTEPGLKAVDLFEACASGKIKALWVMSTNPAVSLPDAGRVAAAIANVPFVVTSDIMEKTDTNDLATVCLPATGWGEKDGTVTTRMGFGKAFAYSAPQDVFAEYIALDAATAHFPRDLDLSIFADADYANLVPTRFQLNTGRNRDQWHTMTRTGKSARLGPHLAEPYVEVHPQDAAALGARVGDLISVESAYGRTILRALITERGVPGQLFAPMHWTRQRAASGTVNVLTAPETDPVSQTDGTAAVQTDEATGLTRVAIIVDGITAALFFAASSPVVISRAATVALIGTQTTPLVALAGRGPADMPDPGATVCSCFNVGRNTLRTAIDDGARSVVALGAATCAGTNCGSCKPELAALLAQASLPMAAE